MPQFDRGLGLDGQVILVTEAARGVGAATTRALADAGAYVIALDWRYADLQLAFTDHSAERLRLVQADVASEIDMDLAIGQCREEFGKLNGFVANAAIRGQGTADDMPIHVWDEILRINLRSVYVGAHFAIPLMRDSGGGSFVAIGSQVGLVGIPRNVAYCAAKGGVINLVRAMSLDHASDNIRANCVCPGPIATEGLADVLLKRGETMDDVITSVPLRRLGRPEEVAHVILFLLSSVSAFTTGAVWVIDGGYTAQ